MHLEIERKFLVKDNSFKALSHNHSIIKQGYLSTDKNRSVRIRVLDNRGFITIKGASTEDGRSRFEWEKEITHAEAILLFQLALPGVIEKTRYLVNVEHHTWEVDVFEGVNKGLVLAEIELASDQEQFVTPPFIGQEVTGDVRYYNAYISQHPFVEWNNK